MTLLFAHEDREHTCYQKKDGKAVHFKRREKDYRYFFVWILGQYIDVDYWCVVDDFGNLKKVAS